MSLNPFSEVRDYPSMRAKIGMFTLGGVLVALFVLQSQIPALESALGAGPLKVKVFGVDIGVGTALVGLILASAAYVAKLHDRISNFLGIRRRFDISEILKPLALGSGVRLTVHQLRELANRRNDLMARTFYKYASSGPGRAVIDAHYIHMALTQWSWYWIVVELCAIALLATAGLLVAHQLLLVAILLAGVLAAIGLLQALRNDCVEYALQQVEQILSDEPRRSAIAGEFNALSN